MKEEVTALNTWFAHAHAHTYTHARTLAHTQTHAFARVHAHTRTHPHTHTHTHTHTHVLLSESGMIGRSTSRIGVGHSETSFRS